MNPAPEKPCPHCGMYEGVTAADGSSHCANCGRPIPASGLPDAAPAVSQAPPSLTPLHLGMRAILGGREYTAVGRVIYSQTASGASWEEWVLLAPQGEQQYLEYDAGQWTLYEAFQPAGAPGANDLYATREGARFSIDRMPAVVADVGPCRISAVEGQIPWNLQPGEPSGYVDLVAGPAVYSAEINRDGTTEWFQGRRVSAQEVFTLFGRHDLVQNVDQQRDRRRSRQRFGFACFLAAGIAFALWAFSSQTGLVVAQGSVPVAAINAQGTRIGPFPLAQPNRVYRLRVATDLTDPSGWVQGNLEDAGTMMDANPPIPVLPVQNGGAINGAQSQSEFRLDKAGNFYVRLTASPEPTSTAHASFTIEQGALYSNYLAVYGVIAAILGGIFLVSSRRSVNG